MSIWTKRWWMSGRNAALDVDSPKRSALRFQYLVDATRIEYLPWTMAALLLVPLFMFLPLLSMAVFEASRSSGGTATAVEEVGRIGRQIGGGSLFKLSVVSAVVIWGLPWLVRLGIDYRNRRASRTSLRLDRSLRRRGRSRTIRLRLIGAWALLLLGLAVAGMLFRSAALLFMLALVVYMATTCAGVGLIVSGWRSRVGKRIVCAKCDYAMGSWRAAGERCPECRNAWKEPWRARIGERRVRVRVLAMGALVLVVNAAGVAVLMSLALRR